jgi:branched-chain amino acid transport system permease protein
LLEIIINILNGLSYAAILFLMASGLSLIFGVMGVLNLAHGSIYLVGAYLGLTVARYSNNFALGTIAAAIGGGLIGLVFERLFLRKLYKKIDEQALLTVGLVYIVANLTLWIWGSLGKMGNAPTFLSGILDLGDYNITHYRLALIVIGLLIYLTLWWLQDRTRIGARVRAGMDDKQMVLGLGINYGLISTIVFVVGSLLGGVAGFLGAPIMGAFPEMSFSILLLAFLVVVIGGIGNIHGALVGSVVIGLLDTFGKGYFPDYAMFTMYSVFILTLLIKPTGILGRKDFDER